MWKVTGSNSTLKYSGCGYVLNVFKIKHKRTKLTEVQPSCAMTYERFYELLFHYSTLSFRYLEYEKEQLQGHIVDHTY